MGIIRDRLPVHLWLASYSGHIGRAIGSYLAALRSSTRNAAYLVRRRALDVPAEAARTNVAVAIKNPATSRQRGPLSTLRLID